MPSQQVNHIRILHCYHILSLHQPPYPRFTLNNGVLLSFKKKPISGFYLCHLQMYLAVNIPRHIATLGGVLILTDSFIISQLFKFTGIPPHLLMHLHGPQIRSILLFRKTLIP